MALTDHFRRPLLNHSSSFSERSHRKVVRALSCSLFGQCNWNCVFPNGSPLCIETGMLSHQCMESLIVSQKRGFSTDSVAIALCLGKRPRYSHHGNCGQFLLCGCDFGPTVCTRCQSSSWVVYEHPTSAAAVDLHQHLQSCDSIRAMGIEHQRPR